MYWNEIQILNFEHCLMNVEENNQQRCGLAEGKAAVLRALKAIDAKQVEKGFLRIQKKRGKKELQWKILEKGK